MASNEQIAETKPPNRGLRALAFAASAILFILSLSALLHDADRQKRSKVEPRTPAEVVSLRSAKSSGYATIKFDITIYNRNRTCLEEIWLGPYYRETKIGDILNIFPDENDCSTPIWPKVPTLIMTFLFFMMSCVIFIVQTGKYIDAVRASRRQAQASLSSAAQAGSA